jgi:hypothetical protein
LREGHPRIDVDEAVDPRYTWVRGDPPRVVVQRGEVGGARRPVVRPDGDGDRREFTLPEGVAKPIEGSTRGHVRGEDARVGRVEPDVEEGRAEQQQERQRRDQDGDRPAHHPPREPRPGSVGFGSRLDLPDGIAIEMTTEQRQQRGEQGEG